MVSPNGDLGLNQGDILPAGWTWPKCPTTTFDEIASWGSCSANKYGCYQQQAYFASTNPRFMDWWTVFYWAWWISWAPFFGVFVGTVSKGRTIRMTVAGGFLAPLLLIMIWFGIFGGLAIKMERVAEMALGVKPDWKHGTVDCTGHYSGGTPISAEAKALESIGYYMIACRGPLSQFYDVLQPYTKLAPFLMPISFLALIVWFVTSSDSGSFVDDLMASSGLSQPPIIQKVYWCWTEGACAIGLLNGGQKSALKALRSASICAGFMQNLFLCFFCTSIYRLVKFDARDEDILASKKFNTQLLDFTTMYQPVMTKYSKHKEYSHTPMTQLTNVVVAAFVPGYTAFEAGKTLYSPMIATLMGLVLQVLWFAFIACAIVQVAVRDMFAISWTLYIFFGFVTMAMRVEMRTKYNIWGSLVEDFWLGLTMPTFCLAQMKMQADNDGEGMRGYCDDILELVEYDAANGTSTSRTADELPIKTVAIESTESMESA
jgi:Cys-rich protein (TIGR01571 family)